MSSTSLESESAAGRERDWRKKQRVRPRILLLSFQVKHGVVKGVRSVQASSQKRVLVSKSVKRECVAEMKSVVVERESIEQLPSPGPLILFTP